MNNIVPKVAAIHDMSGYGRCSLTVAIPILSAMGIQACPMPTALLSSHTAYTGYTFHDFTDEMPAYAKNWQDLGLEFNAIYTGFLGSSEQVNIVKDFAEKFHHNNILFVDPVMGDNGKVYGTYTDEMCEKMKELVSIADIVTPNLTEAAILLGREYTGEAISIEEACDIALEISELGPTIVVLTGIKPGDETIINIAYNAVEGAAFVVCQGLVPRNYHGTGDVFASVLCGGLVNGWGIEESLQRASDFVFKASLFSCDNDCDSRDGVAFEMFLKELCPND